MEQEFISLIKTHEGIILKVCNVYCSHPSDREDLYQDILIQLWKAFPTFDHRSKVTTWMYRIAFNTAVSRFRKQAKQPTKQPIAGDWAAEPPTDKGDDVSALYIAIATLNKIDKAITLLYLDGLKYREIGEIIGITESNVGFKINQIKSKLREILKGGSL
ncbi:MAG: RNA polymerase sigma factor [Bacteroidota bacterium]